MALHSSRKCNQLGALEIVGRMRRQINELVAIFLRNDLIAGVAERNTRDSYLAEK